MLALQETTLTATATEKAVVASLMAEPEAPISDAPIAAPEATGLLLLALVTLLGPKTQPKDK